MSSQVVSFFVPGAVGVAGNKTPIQLANGRIVLREGRTPKAATMAATWRAQVASVGHATVASGPKRWVPLDSPVRLGLLIMRARPKSHYRRDGSLKPSAPSWPSSRPDSSKHLRAIEDACTGVLWSDDARIVAHVMEKVWADAPGVVVAFGAAATTTRDDVWKACLARAGSSA